MNSVFEDSAVALKYGEARDSLLKLTGDVTILEQGVSLAQDNLIIGNSKEGAEKTDSSEDEKQISV